MHHRLPGHRSVSHAWPSKRRCTTSCLVFVALAACGDSTSKQDGAAGAREAGICGNSANPGTLTLAGLSPAKDAIVANQAIVHGFTVVGAPADFTSFDFRYAPTHTAGFPTPANPRFTTTVVGSDIVYQLTIASWSKSPGHVEVSASGGYTTSKNCSWEFPSPLFSYDIIGGADGGAAVETGGALDGQSKPLDVALDVPLVLDVPQVLDLVAGETASTSDGMSAESAPASDGSTAAIDAASIDASID